MATARFFYKDPEAPSPNRPIGVGVLALIDSAGALLMDRRSDCGGWGLPGGAVAPDEALEAALLREVYEETGLAVTDCELFCISADPSRIARYPDGNVVRLLTFAFAARVENLDALRASEESEGLAFLGREEYDERTSSRHASHHRTILLAGDPARRPATLETVVAVRSALRECLLQRTPYIASSTSENSLSTHLGE